MIPLHTHPILRRDPDAQSDMDESITSTTADVATTRKPPSIHSAAKARVYKWSRRIMITTESLWLKKVRRNKFKTFVFIFLPSAFIFLLAFTLAPPRGFSNSNNLMFYMGGKMRPDIMFTAGVIPKRIHSRRDSFDVRYTPLLAALGYGATSIEIYLWSRDGVLYAGTKDPDLAKCETLDELYLSKLQWILDHANRGEPGGSRPCGVFQAAPYLPLQLVMNIKSEGPMTFDALDDALQPFLKEGWLTTVDTRNPEAPPNHSALTIVVTGDVPLSRFLNSPNPTRYMFYDAPLKGLDENQTFTPAISPMASAPFSDLVGPRWVIPRLAKKKIQEYVKTAHDKGIAVRVTKPIDFPVWIRNMYWQMLLDCGVDWLDVDDLYSAGQF